VKKFRRACRGRIGREKKKTHGNGQADGIEGEGGEGLLQLTRSKEGIEQLPFPQPSRKRGPGGEKKSSHCKRTKARKKTAGASSLHRRCIPRKLCRQAFLGGVGSSEGREKGEKRLIRAFERELEKKKGKLKAREGKGQFSLVDRNKARRQRERGKIKKKMTNNLPLLRGQE